MKARSTRRSTPGPTPRRRADGFRAYFCAPEETFTFLEEIQTDTPGSARMVRGRKTIVKYRAMAEQEKTAKRQTVSGVIGDETHQGDKY